MEIDYLNIQYAFWWYIPIAVAAIIGGIVAISSLTKVEGKTLGVLGMRQSGKSRFLANLGLFKYKDEGTNEVEYKEHTLKIKDREILISKGTDVGGDWKVGGDKGVYATWVQEKDIICFIFDGPKFLSNIDYQKDVRSRMQFLYFQVLKKYGNSTEELHKHIFVIASHVDQYPGKDPEEMLNRIVETIREKNYIELLNKNFLTADLRKKRKVLKIANEIF